MIESGELLHQNRRLTPTAGTERTSMGTPREDEQPMGLLPPDFDPDYIEGAVAPFFLSKRSGPR
jgi:hypothetical protein